MIYHEKKPVYLVARKLCVNRQSPDHACDFRCSDKIKKAAANHFKNLTKELKSVLKSSRKEFL
jgi:hypothetical protein